MDTQNQTVSNEDLRRAFTGEKAPAQPSATTRKTMSRKKRLILTISGGVSMVIGIVLLVVALLNPQKAASEDHFPELDGQDTEATYSDLTGEPLADAALKTAPAYCIQVPNGTDGGRPQAGLDEAGVVFEAIAEAGITRFAAIFQNPSTAIIGPIRSLRIYYLEWDTPFNCTIVHAGGAADAIAAVSAGGYQDLSEDYEYMYRGTYGGRRWNNLFTTSEALKQFSANRGYDHSEIKGFARLTPAQSDQQRGEAIAKTQLKITEPAEGDTSEIAVKTPAIAINMGNSETFNVKYNYDVETNTYLRSYASGAAHEVYQCAKENLGEKNPEDVCVLKQLAPKVVVAIVVNERRAADNYHEDITTLGSGEAYIFQNGTAIRGTWQKSTKEDQIKFLDENKDEIKLAPGQTFISAVPNYGSVDY